MHNDRVVSPALTAEIGRSASGELLLTFVDITHPALSRVIRVVCEGDGGVSYANGKTVNYRLGGNLYDGVPFRLTWTSDDDRPAEARAAIPVIDRDISDEIRTLSISPRLRLRVLKSSDFDDLYDADNARNPLGTPTVERDADFLFLRDVTGNGGSISGRIVRFDFGREPCPRERALERWTPGLYL